LGELVHENARKDAQTALRHRRFISARLLIGVLALACMPIYIALRGTPETVTEYVVFGFLIGPLFAAIALSRTGSLPLAHAISAFCFAGLIVAAANVTGGVASPATIWLVTVPLEALLSGSRRSAVSSTLIALAALVFIAGLDAHAAANGIAYPLPGNEPLWDVALVTPVFALLAIAHAGALAVTVSRKNADDQRIIARREAQDRYLLQVIDDLVTWHDGNGHVIKASPGAMKLLGTPASALEERGLLARIHIQDRPAYLKALSDAASEGRAITAQLRIHYGDALSGSAGHVVWTEMRAYPHAGDGDYEVIALLRDISRQKRHEDELENARIAAEKADALKGRFLATVSHELRTPLNAIIGFSEILSSESMSYLNAEQRREYARIIHESGHHLLDVVNSLLDISKIESGNFDFAPSSFEMGPMVEGCVELMRLRAREQKVTLETSIEADLPALKGDPRACRQIVINLLSNAIKFTPEGGSVSLSLRAERKRMILAIADTGVGVGEEDLGKLGNPFFQAVGPQDGAAYDRAHEGTGLGLSVVRGLVGLHGGALSIESGQGAGTTVTVELPLECNAEGDTLGAPIPIRIATRAGRVDQTNTHAAADKTCEAGNDENTNRGFRRSA